MKKKGYANNVVVGDLKWRVVMGFVALTWVLLAILVGVLASKYGRSGFGWFILAILISPLIAGLFLVVAILPGKDSKKKVLSFQPNMAVQEQNEFSKKCPFCAELIKFDAIKCKHCGSEVIIAEEQAKSKEHVFTINCYECGVDNEISSLTVHNFPKCFSCGKDMINIYKKKHRVAILDYINKNRDGIHVNVYHKLFSSLTTGGTKWK